MKSSGTATQSAPCLPRYYGEVMGVLSDCSDSSEVLTGMRLARAAIGRGELIVMPTDTVYGIAADAFSPDAVRALVAAKGRTLASPPPVLVPGIQTLDALAENVPDAVRALVAEFWPGPLTVIVPARSSLNWDLGETRGTVALRMPDDQIALELLNETGPLACSSANPTGQPPARTGAEAFAALGDAVAVVLDAGERGDTSSTIVDATSLDLPEGKLRILREGVISREAIVAIVGADLCA